MKLSPVLLLAATARYALGAALATALTRRDTTDLAPRNTTGLEVQDLEKRSGWFNTCFDPYFPAGTTILSAWCFPSSGSSHFTQLELNNCVGNNNGALVWNGAGFSFTCYNCGLDGRTPFCMCYKTNGVAASTTFNTNNYVSNQNGNLACDG